MAEERPMSLDEMKTALPGAEDLLHGLIGCEWGHGRVGFRPDVGPTPPCQEQAVQIVALHDGPREMHFKLCAHHRDVVFSESTPRE